MSVTVLVLRKSVFLTVLRKAGLKLLRRCTPSKGYLALSVRPQFVKQGHF